MNLGVMNSSYLAIKKTFQKEIYQNKKNKDVKQIQKSKKLEYALIGLGIVATVAVSGVLCLKNKKPVQITLNDIKFNKGLATLKETGEKFTGTVVHKTKDNAIVSLTYLDAVLQEAKKVNADDTIAYIKKYTKDGNKKITSIFKPDTDGILKEIKTLICKNDSIRINGQNDFIEKYFQNAGGKWQRIDNFIDKEKPNSYWTADRDNAVRNYYLEVGMDVNRFLRSGEFCNHRFKDNKIPLCELDDIPAKHREFVSKVINEAKSENRVLIDMLEPLDDFSKSFTIEKPMTVYRDAPTFWMNKAKNGILTDEAFVSTSTVKGASYEGLIGSFSQPYSNYKIHLPAGTKCANLTDTGEKEILLPRRAKFKVIGPNELEYILPE